MAQTIRDARIELGVSQQDMAERLGISRQTYIKMENSPEQFSIEKLRALCAALSKSYEDILFSNAVN